MGVRISHATESAALAEAIGEFANDWDISDFVDLCSTSGYDNDGSTGPELIDNGIGLAISALAYDPQAKIFFTNADSDGDSVCYWQFGRDEQDAVRRFRESIAEQQAADAEG
jgi:hypothetical protein